MSRPETHIRVLVSALLLDYAHLPPTIEWRISVAAFNDPEPRVAALPGEAAG